MVSVPALLKLDALVETLVPVPAMVSVLVLAARAARAVVPSELMVPPCSFTVAECGVVVMPGVWRFKFAKKHCSSRLRRPAADLRQRADCETLTRQNCQ